MVFEPSEFLTVAEQLIKDSKYKNQAGFRTSVSRSYYAAFLVIKKRLEDAGCFFSDIHRLHKDVSDKVMELNTAIGSKLNSLKEHRIDSDYKLDAYITESLARECTKLSLHVINSAGNLKL